MSQGIYRDSGISTSTDSGVSSSAYLSEVEGGLVSLGDSLAAGLADAAFGYALVVLNQFDPDEAAAFQHCSYSSSSAPHERVEHRCTFGNNLNQFAQDADWLLRLVLTVSWCRVRIEARQWFRCPIVRDR